MLRTFAAIALVLLSFAGCARDSPAAVSPGQAGGEAAAAVVDAVDRMFAAMKNHDVEALRGQVMEGAQIVTVSAAGDGTVKHSIVGDADFVEGTAGDASMEIDEHFTSTPTVHIDGPVASLWGPYEVFLNGERKHCGVDVVQLARLDGRWRVTAITYTARPCVESGAPGG